MTSETPTVFAKRLGIVDRNDTGHGPTIALSWNDLLTLAVKSYRCRRPTS